MLLSLAVVYYLRLDQPSRKEFEDNVGRLTNESQYPEGLEDTLREAMDTLLRNTDIADGIASTRGLRENLFVVLVCSLSRTPLMIVGPPGTSKVSRKSHRPKSMNLTPFCCHFQTLAMNAIADNANGSDSTTKFYRKIPRLSLFHYQCSRQSTSKEIAAVFEQAAQRQERVDIEKHRCVVFMDEAGLPEEERESLKVLHYLLEDHMSAKPKVGFVAISNHILDAAKSNRCITLLRQEPDVDEMTVIAMGVLFSTPRRTESLSTRVFFGALLCLLRRSFQVSAEDTSTYSEKNATDCRLILGSGCEISCFSLKL